MRSGSSITLRPAQWPDDIGLLSALNTAFETGRIFAPVREGFDFRWAETAVSPPVVKRYDFDPADAEERRNWDFAAIAEDAGVLAGFAAAQYVAWNRRVILWHLYVQPAYRGQGAGTRLLDAVNGFAQSAGARCLWLETQNVNYPAIQFYRRSGFTFCGFDAALYDPADLAQDETALFFMRPVEEEGTR